MVLVLRAGVAAVPGEKLGKQSQQKDSYKDGHIRNQNSGTRHTGPGPFNQERLVDGTDASVAQNLFTCRQDYSLPSLTSSQRRT
jgi:hypothetical protein